MQKYMFRAKTIKITCLCKNMRIKKILDSKLLKASDKEIRQAIKVARKWKVLPQK